MDGEERDDALFSASVKATPEWFIPEGLDKKNLSYAHYGFRELVCGRLIATNLQYSIKQGGIHSIAAKKRGVSGRVSDREKSGFRPEPKPIGGIGRPLFFEIIGRRGSRRGDNRSHVR